MTEASRACACCFAVSLLGLMRMEAKNLDESIAMADYDNATRKASRLDIANSSLSISPLTKSAHGRNAAAMSTKDAITNKLREAFIPESLDVTDESHLHEGHAGHAPGGDTIYTLKCVSPPGAWPA